MNPYLRPHQLEPTLRSYTVTLAIPETLGRVASIDRVPSLAPVEPPDLSNLREYQVIGVEWLRAMAHGLLADEMRLGKTVQVLRALERRSRTIVVAPASVVAVWVAKTAEWRPDLRATVVGGLGLRRPEEGEILIISIDSLPPPPAKNKYGLILESLREVTLVIDECHMAKTGTAERTQRVRRLGNQCSRVWGLSGTPMLGTPKDLWGVLVTLKLHKRFGLWPEFVKLFGGTRKTRIDGKTGKEVAAGYEWGNVSASMPELMREIMLRRTVAEVYPQLPPFIYTDISCDSPPDLKPYLDEVLEGWNAIGANDLPKFEFLMQARKALARAKIETAIDFIKSAAPNGPMLVFSAHRDPIIAVGQRVKDARYFVGDYPTTKGRTKLIADFQAGEFDVLAMTIDSGGMGIDLSRACHVFFIDEDWTPAMNEQAQRRPLDVSKPKPIQVTRLVTDHPVDRRLAAILDEKRRLIRGTLG